MKKGNKPSVQSTEPKRSELLRADIFPKLIAIKTILDQRRPDASSIERLGRMLQLPSRAIIIGRRPLQRPVQTIKRRDPYFQSIRDAFKYPVQWERKETTKTVCEKRDERREKLFAMGIAGVGSHRSPGQGGSYKRTKGSEISCKRVRR